MSIKDIFPIDKWDFNTQSILADLPEKDILLLMSHQHEQAYKKGEIIFREGSFPTSIYYIRHGKVKKYKIDVDGSEQIIYVANDGELLGYHAVLSGDRYPDSASTLEECTITIIPKEDFLETLQQSSVLSRRLLKTLSHEFTVFANSLTLFAQRPVRERLALQLIVLREKYKENFQPGMDVTIAFTREDLASLVGTARENVVRTLAEFRDAGILETKGTAIIIKDVKKLIAIANYK
jgi:CRP-like cAMP-binding protein